MFNTKHERLVQRLARDDPDLLEVDCAASDVGAEAAGWIGEALASNTCLQTLSLSGNHAGHGVVALCHGLRANGTLASRHSYCRPK